MALRRVLRKLLILIVCLIVLAVVAVILAPMIISAGPGPRWVAEAVQKRINGSAKVDALALSWLGRQSVRGLTITDHDGEQAASLDLTLDASLLRLIFGLPDRIALEASGSLRGELHEDGSISFRDLLRSAEGDDQKEDENRADAGELPSLEGVPGIALDIDELVVELGFRTDAGALLDSTASATLRGEGAYQPGGDATFKLAGPVSTRSRDDDTVIREGRIDLDTTLSKLFDQAGAMTPGGATMRTTLAASDVPVPFTDQVSAVKRFEISATSDDLTDRITVTIDGEAAHGDVDTSTLTGKLTLLQPITPDGRPQFALERTSGSVQGRRIPTVLAQTLVAETPFRLTRDVGEWADISASFPEGERRDIAVTLTADRVSMQGSAVVGEDGSIRGTDLEAMLEVQPELMQSLIIESSGEPTDAGSDASPLSITSPAVLRVTAPSFVIPARQIDGERRLGDLSLEGSILLESGVSVILKGNDQEVIAIAGAQLDVDIPSLEEGVGINGWIEADEGRITIDETLRGLVDADGRLALGDAEPVGTITLQHPEGERLIAFMPKREVEPALRELLAGEVDASIETSRDEAGLHAALRASIGETDASLAAVRGAESLRIDSARVEATLSPELFASLQAETPEEERIGLTESARTTIVMRPIELPGRTLEDYIGAAKSLAADVTLIDAKLTHATLKEPIAIRELTGTATIEWIETPSYSFSGVGEVYRDAKRQNASVVRLDITAETEGDRVVPHGTIAVEDLSVAQVERIIGAKRGRYVDLLGASGDVKLTLASEAVGREATIETSLPNLTGSMLAAIDEDALRLTSDRMTFTARKKLLDQLVAAESENAKREESESDRRRTLHASNDVTLTFAMNSLRIPIALAKGEAFDPKMVQLDATASASSLEIADDRGVLSTLRDLEISLETNDLAQGVAIRIDGKAAARGEPKAGEISVAGTWDGLIAEDGTFAPDAGQFTLDTNAQHVPTALADALMGLGGYLIAAVGDEMNARFASKGFSPDSGWLDGRLDTPNGYIEGIIKGKEASLRNTQGRPIEGELQVTPALRQRLLRPIHPLLADIRSTEHPIRFRIPQRLILPLDGDVSRLKADIEIDVGKVAFDSGSVTLGLLTLFNERKESVAGSIDPIRVKIRDGIVTYEQFTVHVDKYDLTYSGRIDLSSRSVDLRTELPLEGLAMTFQELEGYVDKITVPLVTRGRIGDVKTEIDPDFDLGAAAIEAGFRGAFDGLLKGKGFPGGGLFDDIFRRIEEERKRKDREKDEGGGR